MMRAIEQGAKIFFAACLVAMLNACGSGAVSSASDPTIALTISPSTATAYSGVPTTLVISGGGLRVPFMIVSSNASLVPISVVSISDTQIVFTPGTVTAQQSATITVTDAAGKQAVANITVLPNLINGDITVTGTAPAEFPDCAGAGFICAGQSGTATLTLSQNGAPAKGRSVRFDAVQGNFRFPTDIAQTIFSTSITVTSDESGRVTTVLRADTGAPPQIATIRATDIASGAFRTATFIIKQPTVGGGQFVTVPARWDITGTYKGICPAGTVDFLIFGGTPPYAIRTPVPLVANVYPPLTAVENPSRFSVFFAENKACGSGYQVVFTVTDATGLSIQPVLTNTPGTADAPTPPPTITLSPSAITLGCGQSAQVLVTVTNPGTTPSPITTSIGTTATPSGSLTATVSTGATSATGGVITVARAGTNTVGANPFPVYVGAGSAPPQPIQVTASPLVCP